MKGEKNDCSGGLGGRRKDGFGHIEERASRVVQTRAWTADNLSFARFTPCLELFFTLAYGFSPPFAIPIHTRIRFSDSVLSDNAT